MARRHFRATMFVDAHGRYYSASDTDQAGQRGIDTHGRTVRGEPVEHIGDNYTVERKYQQPIIRAGQARALSRLVGTLHVDGLLPVGAAPFIEAILAAPGDVGLAENTCRKEMNPSETGGKGRQAREAKREGAGRRKTLVKTFHQGIRASRRTGRHAPELLPAPA